MANLTNNLMENHKHYLFRHTVTWPTMYTHHTNIYHSSLTSIHHYRYHTTYFSYLCHAAYLILPEIAKKPNKWRTENAALCDMEQSTSTEMALWLLWCWSLWIYSQMPCNGLDHFWAQNSKHTISVNQCKVYRITFCCVDFKVNRISMSI